MQHVAQLSACATALCCERKRSAHTNTHATQAPTPALPHTLCARWLLHALSHGQAARDAVAGVGDGRISKKDAEAILAKIVDGRTITLTEYRTAMLLLRGSFNFTNEARKMFIDTMGTH